MLRLISSSRQTLTPSSRSVYLAATGWRVFWPLIQILKRLNRSLKIKKQIDPQKRENIVQYFENFKKVIVDKGILPNDYWKFDETGFRIGCGGNQIVIILGA
jgi:hypothetical protein